MGGWSIPTCIASQASGEGPGVPDGAPYRAVLVNAVADPDVRLTPTQTTLAKLCLNLPSLKINNENYNLYLVCGRFPAELGPETRSKGSGSKNAAEHAQN
jgi:hypothetical protein